MSRPGLLSRSGPLLPGPAGRRLFHPARGEEESIYVTYRIGPVRLASEWWWGWNIAQRVLRGSACR